MSAIGTAIAYEVLYTPASRSVEGSAGKAHRCRDRRGKRMLWSELMLRHVTFGRLAPSIIAPMQVMYNLARKPQNEARSGNRHVVDYRDQAANNGAVGLQCKLDVGFRL